MWDNSSYFKKPQSQRSGRKTGSVIHLKRTQGKLVISAGLGSIPMIVPARVVLNDLQPYGVELFCTQNVFPGQEVELSLDHPRPIQVRGKVIDCQKSIPSSRVFSEQPFAFRLRMAFEFLNDGEMQAVADYVEELKLVTPRAA